MSETASLDPREYFPKLVEKIVGIPTGQWEKIDCDPICTTIPRKLRTKLSLRDGSYLGVTLTDGTDIEFVHYDPSGGIMARSGYWELKVYWGGKECEKLEAVWVKVWEEYEKEKTARDAAATTALKNLL